MTRSILITGAASGIGAAICRRIAAPGVAILAHTRRNQAGLEAVAQAARGAGATVATTLGDLTDPAIPAALVDRAVAEFGRLDTIISNAGFADRTKTADLTDDAFARSLDAIQWGFFRLARAAIPHLGAGGRIIAVSSFVAHAFRPGVAVFPASAAAKAGMEALVKALALELAARGVTVNAVVPGFIRKDAAAHAAIAPEALQAQLANIPAGRVGLPDEVAAAIAFLASAGAAYITGQTLHVSGGLVI
ncbi:MAG: SDR family oxidoreductase [Acetobacteraceae bacterium]|nr:SDR family oxidoreductase [Acetobacteraceae bacterium]